MYSVLYKSECGGNRKKGAMEISFVTFHSFHKLNQEPLIPQVGISFYFRFNVFFYLCWPDGNALLHKCWPRVIWDE